ncbi:MAG: hypothetical protein MR927_04150, partial [Campylobacter sp.]|nr:hypothetical protein [Campylobacter sp.]
ELAFERSINTAPLDALKVANSINVIAPTSKEVIEEYFAKAAAGINHEKVCAKLFSDGISAFKEAYAQSINALQA